MRKNSSLPEKNGEKYISKSMPQKEYFSFFWKIQSKKKNIIFVRESMHLAIHKPFFFPKLKRFQLKKIDNFVPRLNFIVFTSNSSLLSEPTLLLNKFKIN